MYSCAISYPSIGEQGYAYIRNIGEGSQARVDLYTRPLGVKTPKLNLLGDGLIQDVGALDCPFEDICDPSCAAIVSDQQHFAVKVYEFDLGAPNGLA